MLPTNSHPGSLFPFVALAPIFRPSHAGRYSVRCLVSLPIRCTGALPSIFCLPAVGRFLGRSRRHLCCRCRCGGCAGSGCGAAVAGFSASALHLATYAFSVILAASFAALLALHSSSQALIVFFCANEGVAENARPEKIRAEHTISHHRLFIA